MQFVHATPAYGAHARQLMQLGVFEVNRSGHYRYFVWLGSWGTSPTHSAASHRDQLESVVLFADGEPLSLSLSGWASNSAGLTRPPFHRPVASAVEAYYEVTPDVLRMIATSTQLSIEAGGADSRRFEPWDAQLAARRDLNYFVETVLR
ncbi:MAG: hypothetical protein QNJ05_03650 [Woeseiaceae bacterium]|nr:hypothetical protein [Woeseiaceae bacterium]